MYNATETNNNHSSNQEGLSNCVRNNTKKLIATGIAIGVIITLGTLGAFGYLNAPMHSISQGFNHHVTPWMHHQAGPFFKKNGVSIGTFICGVGVGALIPVGVMAYKAKKFPFQKGKRSDYISTL